MSWFLYALLGAVFMSGYQVSTRVFLKSKGDSRAFTFVTTFFGSLALWFLLPFEKIRLVASFPSLAGLLILAVVFAFIDLIFTQARQLEEVSVTSVAIQTGFFWSLLGAFLLLGESLSLRKIFGVVLILAGNLFIIWKGQKVTFSKGFLLALLGTLLFNLVSFVDKRLVVSFSPVFYKASLFLFESFWLLVILGSRRFSKIAGEFKVQGRNIVFVGPLIALALMFLNKSFEAGGDASKSLPVFSLSLIFSTLAGVLFLGERENLGRKILAMCLAFVGTYFIQAS